MPKTPKQKLKLLYLAKLFWEETDEKHPVSVSDMIAYLAANDIAAERKSVYDDLEQLSLFGLDIVQAGGGRSQRYFLGSRIVEAQEIRLLVDAVQSSRFLTAKKSEELIRRLSRLLSRHEAKEIGHSVFVSGRIKSMNESIYHIVDRLGEAIETDRAVSFQYYDYNEAGERILHRGGHLYQVSPFHLAWNNENYYLIGFDEEPGEIRHFRVDKMKMPAVLPLRRKGKELFRDFDPAKYVKRMFSMYGGREEVVTLFSPKELIGAMIDRFGDPVFRKAAGGAEMSVAVEVSPPFFAFLVSFGGKVKLLGPESVRKEYRSFLKQTLKNEEITE